VAKTRDAATKTRGRAAKGAPGPVDFGALYEEIRKTAENMDLIVATDLAPTQFFSTGLPLLDLALNGGMPLGRIVHIHGASTTGKTALALWLVRAYQAAYPDGYPGYLDSERALSGVFATSLGLDMGRLAVGIPDTVESAFAGMESMARTLHKRVPGIPPLVVWDSLAATLTMAEEEVEYEGKDQLGRLAAACSRGFKKLRPVVYETGALLIVANQDRAKIGVTYGAKEAPCGGKAPIYYSDVSIKLGHKGKLRRGKGMDPYGVAVEALIEKTRIGFPFRRAGFRILWEEGVLSDLAEMLDALKFYGLAKSSGKTLNLGEFGEFPGKPEFFSALADDPVLLEGITKALGQAMQPKHGTIATVLAGTDEETRAEDVEDDDGAVG
jgi:recombination protein RecA